VPELTAHPLLRWCAAPCVTPSLTQRPQLLTRPGVRANICTTATRARYARCFSKLCQAGVLIHKVKAPNALPNATQYGSESMDTTPNLARNCPYT